MIPYILAENDQGIYVIPKKDLKDRKTARMLRNGTEHEPEIVKIIIENSGDGIVIHAGAYIGDMIPAISKGVERLMAFEPNKEAYNCAMAVKYLNDCDNTSIFNLAVSEKKSNGVLSIDQFRMLEYDSKINLKDNEQLVCSLPLDHILKGVNCSVIHLDIESYEIPALKGAIATIKRDRPVLIIEDLYDTLNQDEWFKVNILGIGYREIKKIGPNRIYKCGDK